MQVRSRPASPVRGARSPTYATVPLVQTHSTPSTPDRRRYVFSDDSPDDTITDRAKMRRGSITLHHAVSLSSLHARSASAVTPVSVPNRDENGSLPLGITQGRVKAKVSALAQQAENLNTLSSSPKIRPIPQRARAPSISSVNASPPAVPASTPAPIFYPITTATAAANPHRFATTRASPPSGGRHHYIPFFPSNDLASAATKSPKFAVARVDPAAITPPMHSPPTSAVSFSSQSSASRSSYSHHTESPADSRTSVLSFSSRPDPLEDVEGMANGLALGHLHALDGSVRTENWTAPTVHRGGNHERSNEDFKIRAEAKSNRKVPTHDPCRCKAKDSTNLVRLLI